MYRIVKVFFVIPMLALLSAVLSVGTIDAHEIRPAIVDINVDQDGQMSMQIKLNLEAVVSGIDASGDAPDTTEREEEYTRLRTLLPEKLEDSFRQMENEFLGTIKIRADQQILPLQIVGVDIPPVGDVELARTSILKFSSRLPSSSNSFTWSWEKELGKAIIRVNASSRENAVDVIFTEVVDGGTTSGIVDLKDAVTVSSLDVFYIYIVQGFEHIIPKGLDHILFVVGLFLLSTKLSSLLWQISSFTLAHTITLGLAIAGIVSVPSSIVEPLIALSIVFVAVENITSGDMHRWRPVVVFVFGLLHGLGFASVLNEVGLQPGNFFAGLLGFNIGVEIGQLSVILACFLVVGIWFGKKKYYRSYITNPASILIAIIGTWWFVERVFL